MPYPNFYVAARDQKTRRNITGYVPSKFLVRNGTYVTDPISGASQKEYLYSNDLGDDATDGRVGNPNNYIIVPANHYEQEARSFAATLSALGVRSPEAMLARTGAAFWPGGQEDMQRNPRWGVPPNSFVPAYTSGASDHFGYIAGAAGLPQSLAEFGGGAHNILNKVFSNPKVDISGTFGLSKVNEANIRQGYAAGRATREPMKPFDNYGYNPQPAAGQIGDGNGILPFSASLSGINPDEPAPPDWPPQQARPIRYLKSTIVPH